MATVEITKQFNNFAFWLNFGCNIWTALIAIFTIVVGITKGRKIIKIASILKKDITLSNLYRLEAIVEETLRLFDSQKSDKYDKCMEKINSILGILKEDSHNNKLKKYITPLVKLNKNIKDKPTFSKNKNDIIQQLEGLKTKIKMIQIDNLM